MKAYFLRYDPDGDLCIVPEEGVHDFDYLTERISKSEEGTFGWYELMDQLADKFPPIEGNLYKIKFYIDGL